MAETCSDRTADSSSTRPHSNDQLDELIPSESQSVRMDIEQCSNLQKPRSNDVDEPDIHQHRQSHNNQNLTTLMNSSSCSSSDYKNAGNKLCALYRYDEAITFYAKAISKDPEIPIFYSNKALCHLKLQQWPQTIQDCRKALELDPNLIKAHFFLGQALAELGVYDDALKHLQRAHELSKEKQLNFGDDIAYQIRLTKRRRWNKVDDENAQLEDELREYLIRLIKADASVEHNACSDTVSGEGPSTQETKVNKRESISKEEKISASMRETIQSKCDMYIDRLETIFNNLKLQRKKRDVPDYLCGKISFEIMHDPVITPSGITYDRRDIEEHLQRVGHFDPITRQPLRANQLIANIAMKEVVDAYLSENEWANYY